MKGVKRALVVCDMPFGTYQGNSKEALASAIRIMKESHAEAVKMEGGEEIKESIEAYTMRRHPCHGPFGADSPVNKQVRDICGTRAREEAEAAKLLADAKMLEGGRMLCPGA